MTGDRGRFFEVRRGDDRTDAVLYHFDRKGQLNVITN